MLGDVNMLTLDDVYRASYVLKEVIRKTDIIHAPKLNNESNIYLKTENLQITGSFKIRGSYYKMSRLRRKGKRSYCMLCGKSCSRSCTCRKKEWN